MTNFLTLALPAFIEVTHNIHILDVLNTVRATYNDIPLIYGIRNNVNGRIYIGASWTPALRWYQHLISRKHSNKALQRALQKYGLENFSLYVFSLVDLSSASTRDERATLMLEAEVAIMNNFARKQLYNFDHSGPSSPGNPKAYGPGKTGDWTAERRAAMSLAMQGTSPINKGVPMSEETKNKWEVGSRHRYFPVGLFDDMNNMVTCYSSFTETVQMEKGGRTTLHQCIKNNKPWKGWYLRYLERNPKQTIVS